MTKNRKYAKRGRSARYNPTFRTQRTATIVTNDAGTPLAVARPKFVTVSIRCGRESLTFRVTRWDAHRFMVRGKVKAASWIGKVVAVAIEGIL